MRKGCLMMVKRQDGVMRYRQGKMEFGVGIVIGTVIELVVAIVP